MTQNLIQLALISSSRESSIKTDTVLLSNDEFSL